MTSSEVKLRLKIFWSKLEFRELHNSLEFVGKRFDSILVYSLAKEINF